MLIDSPTIELLEHAVARIRCGEKDPKMQVAMLEAFGRMKAAEIIEEKIGEVMESLRSIAGDMKEDIRTDHPLMGQTFTGISQGLELVAKAIDSAANVMETWEK